MHILPLFLYPYNKRVPMQEPTCTQCGTCCRKGGPLLHDEDVTLLTKRHVHLHHLVTLRMGEWAHDPTQDTVRQLEAEVIKIAGTQEQGFPWHCILHTLAGCSLHPHRPAQCHALFCQDCTDLKALYAHNHLTRYDILTHLPHKGWIELISVHEEACSVRQFAELLAQEQHEDVGHMIRYDEHFRALCLEKAQIPKNVLPFLFGRPLMRIVGNIRHAIERKRHKHP